MADVKHDTVYRRNKQVARINDMLDTMGYASADWWWNMNTVLDCAPVHANIEAVERLVSKMYHSWRIDRGGR